METPLAISRFVRQVRLVRPTFPFPTALTDLGRTSGLDASELRALHGAQGTGGLEGAHGEAGDGVVATPRRFGRPFVLGVPLPSEKRGGSTGQKNGVPPGRFVGP